MNSNPDSTKQAQEVSFSQKAKEIYHPLLLCNDASVSQSSFETHLRVILDTKLTFDEHLKIVSSKRYKTLELLRKFQNFYNH